MLKGRLELLGVRVLFCKKNKSWKMLDFKMGEWRSLFYYFYISFVIIVGMFAIAFEGIYGAAFLKPSKRSIVHRSISVWKGIYRGDDIYKPTVE